VSTGVINVDDEVLAGMASNYHKLQSDTARVVTTG